MSCGAVCFFSNLGPDRAYWGKGYATETFQEVLRFGFETLGLQHIADTCDVLNTASARVMEKCGLTLEDERDGELAYVITGDEWREQHR